MQTSAEKLHPLHLQATLLLRSLCPTYPPLEEENVGNGWGWEEEWLKESGKGREQLGGRGLNNELFIESIAILLPQALIPGSPWTVTWQLPRNQLRFSKGANGPHFTMQHAKAKWLCYRDLALLWCCEAAPKQSGAKMSDRNLGLWMAWE